ncbi:kinetochore protein SPC24 [Populus alba x Populus x berolinensis]|uniref:Kinetochore protein Spc24 n=1 Tax=Populus alba x Populus x berolinensis TaxID=444605 RepID=A0AAD6LL30_9ROSI|nr:kinetochore protein SPC24 [Populus alba x Populus x berolinensis]
MGDFSGKIDVEKLISFSDDLVAVLKDQKDINNLTHCLQQSQSLKSSCDAEFNDSKTLIEVINNEISDLECQRVSFEERKRNMKRNEKDELRAQRMLSMYASVTNIIPDLDDHSKISGHIVHRDNKAVEKFEFDPTKISSFEICQSIWEMINKQ